MERLTEDEAARRRRVASMLADTLAPLVDTELQAIPPRVVRQPVAIRADRDLIAAAKGVSDALISLDQAKFAGMREVSARQALERAARTLHARLQKRGLADV